MTRSNRRPRAPRTAWRASRRVSGATFSRSSPSTTSAFEAVAGALYLDLGYDATRDWLLGVAAPEVEADLPTRTLKSPKSRLQELSQHRSGERPEYTLVDVSGPDHRRTFRIAVALEGRELGVGEGLSRRIAETAAAAQAIDALESEAIDPGPPADDDGASRAVIARVDAPRG